MSQCQSSRQRQKSRIAAKNRMLIDEMQLLEANLQAVRIAQQEMAATKSSIDAFTWQFNSIKDAMNMMRNDFSMLQNLRYDLERIRNDMQNSINQLQASSGMVSSSVWPLQTVLTELKDKITDINKIVNDPKVMRGLDELREITESIEDL